MGISYIPGPEEILGPALAQIVGGVGNIVDPNFEFRRGFERALATNPQLLQQLADLEFASPGAITQGFGERLLSPNVMQALAGAQPSARAVGERAMREALPTVTGVPVEELPERPTIAQIGAVREVTGARPEVLAQEELSGRQRMLAGEYMASFTPERQRQLGAYITHPAVMSDEHFLMQLDLQDRIFRSRRADQVNEWRLRMKEANAVWWQQHTGVGTAEDWSEYFSVEGRNRLERLKTGGVELTPDDTRLLEIDHHYKTVVPAEEKLLDLNRVATGITKATQSVSEADNDSIRTGQLAVLNQHLAHFSQLTGTPLITAQWTELPSAVFGLGKTGVGRALLPKTLVLTDTATKEVLSPDDLERMVGTAQPVIAPTPARQAPPAATPGATVTPPSAPRDKAQRWNDLRQQMFPGIPAGQLTPQQVQAITSRVNAELP